MADDAKDAEKAQNTDNAGAEGGAAKGDGKKSKKKLFIFAAVAGVLVLGGAGAYFSGALGGGGEHHEETEGVKQEVAYYSMPEMIINLSSPGKTASFVKATVILELNNKLDAVPIEANLPRLMDAFNTYVRELRPSDLAGSAGIARLREELLLRANKALDPLKINDVLFKEIVVQ